MAGTSGFRTSGIAAGNRTPISGSRNRCTDRCATATRIGARAPTTPTLTRDARAPTGGAARPAGIEPARICLTSSRSAAELRPRGAPRRSRTALLAYKASASPGGRAKHAHASARACDRSSCHRAVGTGPRIRTWLSRVRAACPAAGRVRIEAHLAAASGGRTGGARSSGTRRATREVALVANVVGIRRGSVGVYARATCRSCVLRTTVGSRCG